LSNTLAGTKETLIGCGIAKPGGINPEYLASLLSLPLLERERLLGGNWKIRPAAGLYFKRE
jgi:hypothetical protein